MMTVSKGLAASVSQGPSHGPPIARRQLRRPLLPRHLIGPISPVECADDDQPPADGPADVLVGAPDAAPKGGGQANGRRVLYQEVPAHGEHDGFRSVVALAQQLPGSNGRVLRRRSLQRTTPPRGDRETIAQRRAGVKSNPPPRCEALAWLDPGQYNGRIPILQGAVCPNSPLWSPYGCFCWGAC